MWHQTTFHQLSCRSVGASRTRHNHPDGCLSRSRQLEKGFAHSSLQSAAKLQNVKSVHTVDPVLSTQAQCPAAHSDVHWEARAGLSGSKPHLGRCQVPSAPLRSLPTRPRSRGAKSSSWSWHRSFTAGEGSSTATATLATLCTAVLGNQQIRLMTLEPVRLLQFNPCGPCPSQRTS